MRIVLTGATGLLGGELARLLVAAGHDVLRVARTATPGRAAIDCRDAAALAAVLNGRDVLVHSAGISLGVAVAEALRQAPIGRVVAISSAAVSSRSRASAATYRAGEEALATAHPGALFVRPTMIYGSARDRNVHHAIDFARRFHFLPIVGDGAARIQPIHFRDLAAAVVELVANDASGVVHAGGAAAIPLREAAGAILEALGCKRRVARVPHGLARAAAAVGERATRRRIVERVDRMLEERTVDNTRLLALTSARPRDFPSGVRDQVREAQG